MTIHLSCTNLCFCFFFLCRQVSEVAHINGWLMASMGQIARSLSVLDRSVEMYHSSADPASQKGITSLVCKLDSTLQCVVATTAFGMGIQVNDVDFVIHWGPTKDVLTYWQEGGRCARGGRQGHAELDLFPPSMNKRFVDDSMMQVCKGVTDGYCLRAAVLQHLQVSSMEKYVKMTWSHPPCCSVCEE